jgi:hypothetical protein
VSRYLRERPKRPSQTWRTFIANHLGQFEFNTQLPSLNGSGDDLVDTSSSTYCASSFDPLPFVLLEGNVSVRTPVSAYLATSIAFVTAWEEAPAGLRRTGLLADDARREMKIDSFHSQNLLEALECSMQKRVLPFHV